MPRVFVGWLLLTTLLPSAGCYVPSTGGRRPSREALYSSEPGVTTKAEVLHRFGKPNGLQSGRYLVFDMEKGPGELIGLYGSFPIGGRNTWRVSELAPAIAPMIHVKAGRVLAFPEEKRELRDAKKWPKTTVIGGLRCDLRVQELGGDYIADLKSLDQVKPGNAYSLHYEVVGWTGRVASRGPSYYWRSDGRLYERSWRSPDTTRSITDTYQYYTSGELLRHSHRNDSLTPGAPDPQGPYEWFDEVFARNGDLVACGYSKMDGAGARTLAFYVLGKEVGYGEFQSAKVDFIRRAPH